MPRKRNQRTQQRFFCPYCGRRLWHLHRTKFSFLSLVETENGEAFEISSPEVQETYPSFIADNYTEQQTWLKAFLCGEHGELWLKLTPQEKA